MQGTPAFFCWNSKCPAARKRRNFYAYITGTDLFTGITHGGGLTEDSPAPYYRDAAYGYYSGALCVGSAGCVNPEYLIRTAADRADHHFIEGRIIIGSEGSEKSGPLRSHAGLCSCHLRTAGFCDICTHDP